MKLFHLQFLQEKVDGASKLVIKVDQNGIVPVDCEINERKFTAIPIGHFPRSIADGNPVVKYFKIMRCPYSKVDGKRYVHPVKFVEPYYNENVLRSFTALKEDTSSNEQAAIFVDATDPFAEVRFLKDRTLYRTGKFVAGVYQTKWVNDQTLTSNATVGILDKNETYQIVYTDPNTSEKFVASIKFDGETIDILTRPYEEQPRQHRKDFKSRNHNEQRREHRKPDHARKHSRMGSFGEALQDAGFSRRPRNRKFDHR